MRGLGQLSAERRRDKPERRVDPSSDLASRGHLLLQGEKDDLIMLEREQILELTSRRHPQRTDRTTHDYTTFDAPLPHPGETLREDFLPQYGLTAGSLAKAMGLKDRTRIERLVREQQPISCVWRACSQRARTFG